MKEFIQLNAALPDNVPDRIKSQIKFVFLPSIENRFRSRLAEIKVHFYDDGTPLLNYVLVNGVVRLCKIEYNNHLSIAHTIEQTEIIQYFLDSSRVYKDSTIN